MPDLDLVTADGPVRVFALLHGAQYGLNASIVGLFLVTVVFGLERKYVNTTAAMITHALFNFIQVAALSLM